MRSSAAVVVVATTTSRAASRSLSPTLLLQQLSPMAALAPAVRVRSLTSRRRAQPTRPSSSLAVIIPRSSHPLTTTTTSTAPPLLTTAFLRAPPRRCHSSSPPSPSQDAHPTLPPNPPAPPAAAAAPRRRSGVAVPHFTIPTFGAPPRPPPPPTATATGPPTPPPPGTAAPTPNADAKDAAGTLPRRSRRAAGAAPLFSFVGGAPVAPPAAAANKEPAARAEQPAGQSAAPLPRIDFPFTAKTPRDVGKSGKRKGAEAAGKPAQSGDDPSVELDARDDVVLDVGASVDGDGEFGRESRRRASAVRHSKAELDGGAPDSASKRAGKRSGGKKAGLREREQEDFEDERKKAYIAPKDIYIPDGISVVNLGSLMGVQYAQLAKSMKKLGFENTNTDFVLTSEIASLVAMEYGFNPIVNAMSSEEANFQPRPEPEDWSSYPTRRPVVTIMGHVDHGKTTLLDTLRKSAVAAGEAGGITQHIGAFSVKLPSGKQITFLDTPGHAAFSAMRARGAKVTDIVVLVVAADDGVMPQTVEAIKHAQAAGVDLIVAINKCDKPGAKPAKVKEGLLRYDVVLEEYGGEIPSVEVSGLTGMGLLELEETIITMSELADLRGDPTGPVEATIIESRVARGRGNCATAIVKRGTLKNGQILFSGTTWAKVRALCDENGRPLKEAGPSVPVELSGWKDLPVAGDAVLEAADEDLAKRVVDARMASSARSQLIGSIDALNERRAEWRAAKESEKNAAAAAKKGRAAAARRESEAEKEAGVEEEVEGEVKMLYLVLKADVHGSLEAITDAISGLPSHEVQVKIVDSGVGAVTTSDIEMAEATGAILITFNLPVDKKTLAFAKQHSVPLHPQTVIYKLLDDLKDAMADLLPPVEHHEVVGEAEILQLFDIKVKGSKEPEKAAGCRVLTGKIARASCVKVVRGSGGEEVVYDGTLKSFRHHKKDITEAPKGLECGMSFENNPAALAVGDRVVCYNVVKSRRKIQ